MCRVSCLTFLALMFCLSSSLPSAAEGQPLDILLAEKKLEQACARVGSSEYTLRTIVRSHLKSLADSTEALDRMQRIVANTGKAYVSQGILSDADYDDLIDGRLRFHPEPKVRDLIDAMTDRAAFIDRTDKAEAEREKRIEDLAFDLSRLKKRKEELKRELKRLQSGHLTGGIVGSTGSPSPDFRTEEEILDEMLRDLQRLSDRLDDLDRTQAELLDQAAEDHAARIRRLTELLAAVPDQTGKTTDRPRSYPSVSIMLGRPSDTDMTFTSFGQRLNTNDRWAGMLSASWPLSGRDFGPWNGFWTANYAHVEMDQLTHVNIATGVPGPSAGRVTFDYLGLGLAFERRVSRHGRLGLGAGLGALIADIGGSFRASDTVAAAKFEAYYLHGLQSIRFTNGSFPLSGGPFASVIVPFDDFRGGAGPLLSDVEMDPVFILGIRFDLGAKR